MSLLHQAGAGPAGCLGYGHPRQQACQEIEEITGCPCYLRDLDLKDQREKDKVQGNCGQGQADCPEYPAHRPGVAGPHLPADPEEKEVAMSVDSPEDVKRVNVH